MSCRPRGCKESDVTGLPNNNGNQHPGKMSGLNIPETQQLQQTGWLRAFLWQTLEKLLGVRWAPRNRF